MTKFEDWRKRKRDNYWFFNELSRRICAQNRTRNIALKYFELYFNIIDSQYIINTNVEIEGVRE